MALFKFLIWIADKIREQAEAELYDEDHLRQALSDLYSELEAGAIGEEEFKRREAELVARIVSIEEAKRSSRRGEEG